MEISVLTWWEEIVVETRYSYKVKALSRELAGYDHFTVIEAAFKNLQVEKADKKDMLQRLPWLQFFLLKLALLAPSGNKRMDASTFARLANKLHRLQFEASGLAGGDVVLKLRPMMLQQLWYQAQKEHTYLDFIRQGAFFSRDPWYQEGFKSVAGISLDSFYKISMHFVTVALGHTHSVVDLNLIGAIYYLCPSVPFEDLFRYLKLTGIRTADLPLYFEAHRLEGFCGGEFFQDTPLKDRPILINGTDLLVYDVDMFFSSMAQYVPTVLKKVRGFKDKFGLDFERYVDDVLQHSGVKYWKEGKEIAEFYRVNGIKGKVIDFLVEGDGHVVLIESKAIEPSPIVKTASDPELLKKLLGESFIKAIKQGFHTAWCLGKTERFFGKKFSLLVVTHMDFGIYGGRWVSDYVDKGLEGWAEENYPQSPLSLDDVIYCTVADLEDLSRGHAAAAFDFVDVVSKAGVSNLETHQQKMVFSQMFKDLPKERSRHQSSISKLMDKSISDMENQLRNNKKWWRDDVKRLVEIHDRILLDINSQPYYF